MVTVPGLPLKYAMLLSVQGTCWPVTGSYQLRLLPVSVAHSPDPPNELELPLGSQSKTVGATIGSNGADVLGEW